MNVILVAIDDSESSNRAIDLAAAMATVETAKLRVITVLDASVIRDYDLSHLASVEGGIGEAMEMLAADILHRAKERARLQGIASIDVDYCWGDPSEAIIEAGRNATADVIVVGRRGRGRLAGLLLGSVSQKLVSLAPFPVLVVP